MDDDGRIRVLVVDDHPLFRAGVCARLVEQDPDLEIVGEAGSGEEARAMAASLHPQVVLMDVAMPGQNGLEVTRAIKGASPEIAVILLSLYDDEQYVAAAVEAGAAGYLLKTVQGAELAGAVRRAHLGDVVLSNEMAGKVYRRLLPKLRSSAERTLPHLSEREMEVLALVAQGASNKEIALSMQLSERTVHAHLRNVFGKLAVASRTEAVMLAVKEGLLDLDQVELHGAWRD